MNSRELVRRTVTFGAPARVPTQAWVLPWAEEHHPAEVRRLREEFPDDIVTSPGFYRRPLPVRGERYRKGVYTDEWGCRFHNLEGTVAGLVREPLIRDWADLAGFQTPDCTLDLDGEAVNAFCAATGQFVLAGTLVRPFERYCFIRTMEQALVDVFRQPAGFGELLRRLHHHYVREVEAWSATDVDAIVIMDDWGGQDRMLVPPALWREVFKPIYRDYCEVARRAGKVVFMHSDGRITEIVEDLIEVGVQALNSQVECMGVAELGARFRGRLTFWGGLGREDVLAHGSRADVRAAVREMRRHLHADGGVIGQCEFGPGASPDNVLEAFRAWRDPGGGDQPVEPR